RPPPLSRPQARARERATDSTRRVDSSRSVGVPGTAWTLPACYQMRLILPDADSICRSEIELLSRLNAERLIPGVHVADDVGANGTRRMGVGEQSLTQVRLTVFAAPDLRPT